MKDQMMYTLRVIWACAKKDLKSALTERLFTILGIFVPVNVLLLLSLLVISGGQAPTAVVMNDSGPYAQQLYTAMSHAHSFVLQQTTAATAAELLHAGKIVAVVTIPAEFDARLQHNQPVQVDVQINNLNTDFTNDIRRAVPLSITLFYAKAMPHIVTVTTVEQDQYARDTDYIPYLGVSILVIGLVLGALLQSGPAAAREWENATIKELLLSPASRWAIILGKILGAFIVTLAGIAVVLAVLILGVGVWPAHWLAAIGFSIFCILLFLALGTWFGNLLKARMPVLSLSFGLTIPLFFLSGAFGPLSFTTTPIVQVIAELSPIYYAIVLEQYAFHNFALNTYGPGMNVLILCIFGLIFAFLATATLWRRTVAH